MDIFVVKRNDGSFIPAYEEDKEKSNKIKAGDIVRMSYKKVRNPKFHRKYFALISMIFDNQSIFQDKDKLRDYLTIKSGFFTEKQTDEGILLKPKSISFDKMDDTEFSKLFDTTLLVIEQEFGINNEDLLQHLNDFI